MEKQRALIKLFLKIAFFDSLKWMGWRVFSEISSRFWT
jgi:hypothetical protein